MNWDGNLLNVIIVEIGRVIGKELVYLLKKMKNRPKIRKNWTVCPVTRIRHSKKNYKRDKRKDIDGDRN